jgi:hypothetical protein
MVVGKFSILFTVLVTEDLGESDHIWLTHGYLQIYNATNFFY